MKFDELATTNDFLDMLKEKFNLSSDYKLAQSLGWSSSLISTYRCKPQYLGDKNCIEAADALGVPPAFVLCCVHAERTKDPQIKKYWQDMAVSHRYRKAIRRTKKEIKKEFKRKFDEVG